MAYAQNTQSPNLSNALGQTPAERWRYSTLNDMLMSIGLTGIDFNASISDSVEGQQALRIFTDVLYEVESEGWEFNTLSNVTIKTNSAGQYKFNYETSPYIFSLVSSDGNLFVSMDGTIKDRDSSDFDTSVIADGCQDIILSKVIIEAWADMHYSLMQYITALAINRFQALMIGDSTMFSFTQKDVSDKYVKARRDEIRSGKYNILNSSFGQEVSR